MKFFPDNVGCITEVYSVASIRQFTYWSVKGIVMEGRGERGKGRGGGERGVEKGSSHWTIR
jgi:hypothetical protein